jgi:uncharacterized protein YndB with AHSA1/START domain
MDDVTREVELDADPQDVWDLVTSSLPDWFDAEIDRDLAPGEVVRFTSPDGTVRRALIERMDEPREIAFRWLPSPDEPPSHVDITIDPTDGGSIIRVTEKRFAQARIGFKALARL